jgi:hypothetical protein
MLEEVGGEGSGCDEKRVPTGGGFLLDRLSVDGGTVVIANGRANIVNSSPRDLQLHGSNLILLLEFLDDAALFAGYDLVLESEMAKSLVLLLQVLDPSFETVDLLSTTSRVVKFGVLLLQMAFEFVNLVQSDLRLLHD